MDDSLSRSNRCVCRWSVRTMVPVVMSMLAFAGCSFERPQETLPVQERPRSGGTFHIALEGFESLDPAFTDDAYEATVINQVFSGLLRADDDLNVLPDVAQSWTISPDGLEYVFELREDARFHHGRNIAADDFVFTFTRLLDPRQIAPGIIQDYLIIIDGAVDVARRRARTVRGLSAPDPHTLVIRLSKPYPSFLSVLCMDQAKVVPRDVIEKEGPERFGRHPVGSGPFRLAQWDPQGLTILTANKDYFGTPAHLDSVIVHPYVHDGGVQERRDFYAGKLDVLSIRQSEIPELMGRGAYHVVRRLELAMEFVGINSELPPLNDLRVRQALSLALDRSALERVAGPGFLTPAGILPPGMPGYTPDPKIHPYDPDRARELLARAGFGAGRPLTFDFYVTARSREGMARDSVLVDCWSRVGIEARRKIVNWAELNQAIDGHTAPAFVITWIGDLPDPDTFLFTLLASEGTYNMVNFRDREMDTLLARGRSERDIEARLDWYRRAERRALDQAALIPLFNNMTAYAFQPHVRGVEMSPFGICSVPMRKVWFEKPAVENAYAGL